ncbi:beta-galactosidase [Sinobaca qinghaiensis]|uniref:Beta-galactosidase n=1 Tax=Sinobaca qinghaiensis TaxID=342944 RepID=A0A419V813_9BACL|nr:beta-galactosidase [Sinobaca qinghaiensis]RKD76180.1 beta-galactosidase [Sinobaca qinghaiensis]
MTNTRSYFPNLLHGADYNPEQWLHRPDILEEDVRLMKLAKCNVMSVGIFSWVSLEPEENHYTFEWMQNVLDRLYENDISVFLATPSGSRPAWMSEKYPEVLRTNADRTKNLHGLRHNHCLTSPVYRKKVRQMAEQLAAGFGDHPAVIGWHISNEYGGDCHCSTCQASFRHWLKEKYETLDALNSAWWTTFWSHTYTSWNQIESPSPLGESLVHGLTLDWKRYTTDQTVDFYQWEAAPLKEKRPDLPATTNFMEEYEGLDYWKFKDVVDIVSWDAYPTWHDNEEEAVQAARTAFLHDIKRSIKGGQPFLLMESTPSNTNWQPLSTLKKPGMHHLSSLQAVAHGSDSVQYFQWRKSQGSSEKFHGAVVDHVGHENTRVFKEVAQVGKSLERLKEITGAESHPKTALVYDWENRWAINEAQGPRNIGPGYEDTVQKFYRPLWDMGIAVDVIDSEQSLEQYDLIVMPMLYMIKPGTAERIEAFVKRGGTLVTTYWSGIVDENDLVWLGGLPGPLRNVLGIWSEEIDSLHDGQTNQLTFTSGNLSSQSYQLKELCDLIHLESARSLASYDEDFYQGRPAVTVNAFGEGKAYYIAARTEEAFYTDFLKQVVEEAGIEKNIQTELPRGVTVQRRVKGERSYLFLLNFTKEEKTFSLHDKKGWDLIHQESVQGDCSLEPYGVRVVREE